MAMTDSERQQKLDTNSNEEQMEIAQEIPPESSQVKADEESTQSSDKEADKPSPETPQQTEKDSDSVPDNQENQNKPEAGNVPGKSFIIKAFGFYLLAIFAAFLLATTGLLLFPDTYGDAGSLYRVCIALMTLLIVFAIPYAIVVALVFRHLKKKRQSLYQRWNKKKVLFIGGAAIFICLIFAFSFSADPSTCPHIKVVKATCTEPKECVNCGAKFGASLGHNWQAATCVKPKTCKRCGETYGKPAGHKPGTQWTTVKEATCTSTGVEKAQCTVCGVWIDRDTAIKPHTPGEMTTTQEASVSFASGQRVATKGKREQKCTACGAVLKTEEFEPTEQQNMDAFKTSCPSFSYNDVARNPDQFNGSYATFTGKVIQVMENSGIYTLRVNKDSDYSSTILVTYFATEGSPRILEDDVITFWGTLSGVTTYESIFGQSITIPSFTAAYIG